MYGTATTTAVKIHGTAAFYGAVYAPTADIAIVGTSDNYGAFVGKSVTTTGNAVVHYDACLGTSKGMTKKKLRMAFWQIG